MKKIYIQELAQSDSHFGQIFAVKGFTKKASRNNKPYFDVELSDKTGSIGAKIWSDDIPNCEEVRAGDVVSINFTVEEFNGALQLRITNLSKTTDYDPEDLKQRSKFDTEEMWNDVEKVIESIKNPHLRKLLNNIFSEEDTLERYKNGPGAYKIHHNYASGLLEHTWEMLGLAKPLKKQFPKLNMDLIYAGIILHDLGKAFEFDMETTITFRDEGKLLGHVYLGAEKIKSMAPKDMPEDLLDEILHIVLSHQGEKEHGAVIVPKTAEAMAVYVLDYASFRINLAYESLHGTPGTEKYTQFIPHLSAELYRSPYTDDDINEAIPF